MSAVNPPPCPMCTGKMLLKEQHRMAHSHASMLFFRCTTCGVEYPRASDTTAAPAMAQIEPGGSIT